MKLTILILFLGFIAFVNGIENVNGKLPEEPSKDSKEKIPEAIVPRRDDKKSSSQIPGESSTTPKTNKGKDVGIDSKEDPVPAAIGQRLSATLLMTLVKKEPPQIREQGLI